MKRLSGLSKEQRAAVVKAERALRRLEVLANRERKLAAERHEARRAILEYCPHPPERRTTYRWEHDNGYGRQSIHTGEQCGLCMARNRWPGSSYPSWYLEEWLQ
jgi:hypothetical protein